MSSLPGEVLRDVLLPLDRWTLDDVQFTDRRFLQLIMERMSDVCLREVNYSLFYAEVDTTGMGSCAFRVNDQRPLRTISSQGQDTAGLFAEFLQALRSSRVNWLAIRRIVFTAELAEAVLQTPIVAGKLEFSGSCAELTPTQFQEVITHFSPTYLSLGRCHLRACQLNDGLLQALSKKGMAGALFSHEEGPVDADSFCVTDDAIVAFCTQQDVRTENDEVPSRHKTFAQLTLYDGSFTKDLVKRLVEAISASMRTQSLKIQVSPVTVADEDLRDFAEHLSYAYRGQSYQQRILDFPAEQQGADAAMHLRIVLHSHDNTLVLLRAPSSDRVFHHNWYFPCS
ncbi:hypothetical protein AAVH_27183 [Aphelenchoides avenae]|nr:hypothetical protein AAVH_27183 [Aphelenchus avenae]